jgi:anti-anti-sigma factor
VLRCTGEEDSATQSLRRRAFSRAIKAPDDVTVDLSQLSFADASLSFDLAILAQRLRNRGRRLRLCNAQPQIVRLFELAGLLGAPGVLVAG